MNAPLQLILPSDVRFTDSLDVGEPGCFCSRCRKLIGEGTVPIRAWPESAGYEYRYHPECLGFEVFDEPGWDDEGQPI